LGALPDRRFIFSLLGFSLALTAVTVALVVFVGLRDAGSVSIGPMVRLPVCADPTDARPLIRRLNEANLGPVDYDRIDNTFSVPVSRLPDALVWMAREKILPENGEAFDLLLTDLSEGRIGSSALLAAPASSLSAGAEREENAGGAMLSAAVTSDRFSKADNVAGVGNAGNADAKWIDSADELSLQTGPEPVRSSLIRLLRGVPGVMDATVEYRLQRAGSAFEAGFTRLAAGVTVTTPPGRRLTEESVQTVVRLVAAARIGVFDKMVEVSDRSGYQYRSLTAPTMAAGE